MGVKFPEPKLVSMRAFSLPSRLIIGSTAWMRYCVTLYAASVGKLLVGGSGIGDGVAAGVMFGTGLGAGPGFHMLVKK